MKVDRATHAHRAGVVPVIAVPEVPLVVTVVTAVPEVAPVAPVVTVVTVVLVEDETLACEAVEGELPQPTPQNRSPSVNGTSVQLAR